MSGRGQRLLELPRLAQGDDGALSGAYGADVVAARYCGFPWPPSAPFGVWQHGWLSPDQSLHPDIVALNYSGARHDQTYWVARQDQADYLEEHGYGARAIGLPVVYLPPVAARPAPGSLLVIPPHTLSYISPDWDCRAYVEAIDAIRGGFGKVVVCVHPSCWERGLWRNDFAKAGYEVVRGLADAASPTALHALQAIFSRFECVTTNSYGSHLVYASYFGARVSLYGPAAPLKPEHVANALVYKRHPALLERRLEALSAEGLRRTHPDFFTPPGEAPLRVEWAGEQLGARHKVPPAEMRRLFRWTAADRMKSRLGRLGRRLHGGLPARVRLRLRRACDAPFRIEADELARLRGMAPFTPGETNLLGVPFSFVDAPSFLFTRDELVRKQIYAFATGAAAPRIIDCGANIGLSVLYFKSLHPGSRITAFEPDPAVFATLEKNCRVLGLEGVELRHAAVWTGPGALSFRRQGGDAGRVSQPGEEAADSVSVPAVPLRDLLDEPVQMLKIDIEGAEIDVLESCADRLGNVEHLFIEYHSFVNRPQHLDRLMAVLTRAGFRLHIDAFQPSLHPLLFRDIRTGMDSLDMNLNVFAFR